MTPPDHDAPKIVNKEIKYHLETRHDKPKMLIEKLVITLLIVGAELIAYHFW